MHGNGAEGSSQGSRADVGAERRRLQRARAKYYREQEGLATWGGSAKQAGSCGLNRP